MSINALSQASSIWSRATTALSPTPDASGLDATKPNEAGTTTGSSSSTTASGQPSSVGSSPFEQLASDLQAVLLQMQSGQDGVASTDPTSTSTSTSTTATPTAPDATGSTSAAPAHHHHHHGGGAGPASATTQTSATDPANPSADPSATDSSDITSLLAVA